MLICLACYGDRLATLMENATELRFYKVERHVPVVHGTSSVSPNGVFAMIDMLEGLGVDTLICGGLSGCALAALQQSGVPVVPWIGGTAAEVAAAWAAGGIDAVNRMRMPGCAICGCTRRNGAHGQRRGQVRRVLRSGAHIVHEHKQEKPS